MVRLVSLLSSSNVPSLRNMKNSYRKMLLRGTPRTAEEVALNPPSEIDTGVGIGRRHWADARLFGPRPITEALLCGLARISSLSFALSYQREKGGFPGLVGLVGPHLFIRLASRILQKSPNPHLREAP